MPTLHDVAIDRGEVDFAELHEVRVGPAQHMEDSAALVGDAPQRDYLDTVDRRLAFAHSSTEFLPSSETPERLVVRDCLPGLDRSPRCIPAAESSHCGHACSRQLS